MRVTIALYALQQSVFLDFIFSLVSRVLNGYLISFLINEIEHFFKCIFVFLLSWCLSTSVFTFICGCMIYTLYILDNNTFLLLLNVRDTFSNLGLIFLLYDVF